MILQITGFIGLIHICVSTSVPREEEFNTEGLHLGQVSHENFRQNLTLKKLQRQSRQIEYCVNLLQTYYQQSQTGYAQGFPRSMVPSQDGQPKLRRIGVQGAPIRTGQRKPGVEHGPGLIRSSGIVEFLVNEGHNVLDYGDVYLGQHFNGERAYVRNPAAVAEATRYIYYSTKRILQDNRFPLTFGGDHSMAIATLSAVSEFYPDLAVIYIDAHADINTVQTTPTGNLHGMPLSFVIRELSGANAALTDFSWVIPRIPAANLAHIGLRDVNVGEIETLNRLGMASFNMRDVDRLGIRGVVDVVLNRIGGRTRPVYISFDIDSLDDLEVGHTTGTPVPGGLTVRDALSMLDELYRTVNLVGFELAEVNPSLGSQAEGERTATISGKILACAFGSCRGHGPIKPGKFDPRKLGKDHT